MSDVGDDISVSSARWDFRGDVVPRFDQHIERSVPFYREGHELVARISDFFVHDGSIVYDLGCATGTLSRLVADRHRDKRVMVVGIDWEADMVAHARDRYAGEQQIEFRQEDIQIIEFEPTDFLITYYTIQFLRPSCRQEVVNRIYEALNWGGAFLLFEKVRGPDARFQDIATALYTDYKLDQGYSETEIINKSRSLKGVLEPFSTQGNLDLLRRAGFRDVMTVFKYVCFEGFLAIK